MDNQEASDDRTSESSDEQVSQEVSGMLDETRRRASEMASHAWSEFDRAVETGRTRADQARTSTADGLQRAASKVQETADRLPGGDTIQNAARSVAGGMERSATYLREHDFNDMQTDIGNFVRRHPAPSLVVALATGFLVGQALRRPRR